MLLDFCFARNSLLSAQKWYMIRFISLLKSTFLGKLYEYFHQLLKGICYFLRVFFFWLSFG